MDIKMMRVADIIPYGKNPRKNDSAVDAVAASIKAFGFKVPVVIDAAGVIVAGHTRVKAAKRLGIEEVPCVVADDLSPEQIKAFRLADNKVSELAEWDDDLLALELFDLDFDMNDFGFDEKVEVDDFDDAFELKDGEKEPFRQLTFTLHDQQAELIQNAIKFVNDNGLVKETFGNENKNGNGLYEVVREWVEQRTL